VTWYGRHFSYHGACDLILVRNPSFALGQGLDLHVRTAHMMNQAFSFVSNAALKIGKDILEVTSGGDHLVNGVLNTELPATVGGFEVSKSITSTCSGKLNKKCADVILFNIVLMGNDEISIKVASNMIHVDVKGSARSFNGSSGLMGTFPAQRSEKLARDGKTQLKNVDDFAQEWQVMEMEQKLFHETRAPQHPEICIPAVQSKAYERRLRGDSDARFAAEEACLHVKGPEWEFCIFDVMVTGDYGMAFTVYGEK